MAAAAKSQHNDYNTLPGTHIGQSVGKALVKKQDKLKRDLNAPLYQTTAGRFPVQVAPFNETEANFNEKVDVYEQTLLDPRFKKLKDRGVTIPFSLDSKEIAAVYEQKRAAATKLNWYKFLEDMMKEYNYSPDIVKYVREMAPEYYEERLAEIDRNLELQRMAARLKLKVVPDTPDELRFLYSLAAGEIELPKKVAYDTSEYATTNAANLKRGLFSVKNHKFPSQRAGGDIFGQLAVANDPFGGASNSLSNLGVPDRLSVNLMNEANAFGKIWK